MCTGLRKVSLLVICIMSIAVSVNASDHTVGKGISANDTILVSDLTGSPDTHVDQLVRVTGPAMAVCEQRGSWIDIASDVEGETIRVKVAGGEMSFPLEIRGELVTAEGIWTRFDLDLETTRQIRQLRALEAGEEFDASTVTEGTTVWQITCFGAVVIHADHDHDHGHDHDGHDHHDHDDHDGHDHDHDGH